MISGYREAFDGRLLTWDARIVQHWSSRVIGLSGWAKWERVHPNTSTIGVPLLVHSSRRAGCYDARTLFTRNNFTVRTAAERGLVVVLCNPAAAPPPPPGRLFWTLCFRCIDTVQEVQ